ncbi:MAG: GCN5-related N-acetyltransferase [Firmicutes bacterium]|nr:GCN5-related N-acetyltransferase [Bacillota bacterium]
MLVEGKLLSYRSDLSEVYRIRQNVFIDEMGICKEDEFDGQDDMAMHVIVYEESGSRNAVATGRICFDGTNCEIGHIAVLKEYRKRKYGDFAVRMLINKAIIAGIKEIVCYSFQESVSFFQTIGFHLDSDEIIYNNQKRYKMTVNESDIIPACQKNLAKV